MDKRRIAISRCFMLLSLLLPGTLGFAAFSIQRVVSDLNKDGKTETVELIPSAVAGHEEDGEDFAKYSVVVKDSANKILWTSSEKDGFESFAQNPVCSVANDADGDGKPELMIALPPTDVSPDYFTVFRWDQVTSSFHRKQGGMLVEYPYQSGNFVWCDSDQEGNYLPVAHKMEWGGVTTGSGTLDSRKGWQPDYSRNSWIRSIDTCVIPAEVTATVVRFTEEVLVGSGHFKATPSGYKLVKWIKPLKSPVDEGVANVGQESGEKQDWVVRYRCVIGQADIRNSKGQKIETVGGLLGQDRANFHKFKVRQTGDEEDSYFISPERRVIFDRLSVQCDAGALSNLRSGKPVTVTVYKDRIQVTE